MANVVRILITAKEDVSGELDKIRDKATLLSKTDIGKGLLQGAGIAAFGLIQSAATNALGAVTDFAVGSVAAAREEAVGIARLGAALQSNVKDWDGNTSAIERQIGAMVKTTGFSDGEMRDSLAHLVAATHDVNKAFAIQSTAMDLARFKGISLADASDALIKVEGGQYRALKGLGIVLKEGATQTDALAAVQKVAGGQMAAYMDTLAGKTDVLNNRLEDLQEELGAKVTPAFIAATEGALNFMDALDPDSPETLDDRLKTLSDTLTALNPLAWSTSGAFDGVSEAQKREADAAGVAAAETAKSWDTGSERVGAALGQMADTSATTTQHMKADQRALRWDFKKTSDYLLNDYTSNVDKAMGIQDAREALSVIRHEAAVDKKAAASHTLTTKEKKEADKRAVVRDQEAADEFAKLSEMGALSKKDYATWAAALERLARGTKGKVHDAYIAAIADIRRLQSQANANIDVNVSYSSQGSKSNTHGKAAGGPLPPYATSLVGENGPEIVSVGSGGAMVNPSAAGWGGGGAMSVTLNVSTPLMTPGSAKALADALGPVLTKWQQDRRLLARP